MPLGSLLGPLEALLRGLKSEKMSTVQRENHFFINAVFWLFEAPDGLLGLILALLGRYDPKMGPKMDPKRGPKSEPKNDPKNDQKREQHHSHHHPFDFKK